MSGSKDLMSGSKEPWGGKKREVPREMVRLARMMVTAYIQEQIFECPEICKEM